MDKSPDWHQDDDFWVNMAPFMFTDEAWSAAADEAAKAIDLMALEPGAKFLDLACGPGRHSMELARRGYKVVAVDRSIAYLDEARRRAEQEGLTIEFVQADMRDFLRPAAFNGAWSMFTSFGYFRDPADNQRVLENVCQSLRDGGSFLIDLAGREVIARKYQQRDWREVDDVLLLEERIIERNWTMMLNRRILIKDSKRKEYSVLHWLYSGSELIEMLLKSGFSSVRILGDLEGSSYDNTASRLVALARK